jgi:predicted nucleic acid-binding protein
LQVIYDTNILLQILRNPDSVGILQSKLSSLDIDGCISIVTVAEIRSLAFQFKWGNVRQDRMQEAILSVTTQAEGYGLENDQKKLR